MASVSSIRQAVKSVNKYLKWRVPQRPQIAQKVNIVSDEVTQIPGTLNTTTGTRTFKDIGAGIRVVEPGPNTRLGKLGIENVTRFPQGYFGNEGALYSIRGKDQKGAFPMLMNKDEFKSTLEFLQDMKKLENPSLLKKFQNACMKVMEYLAPAE